MQRAARLGALLLLATLAGGCAGATSLGAGPPPAPAARAASGGAADVGSGTEVGNGRAGVTHDGLMVRRRVAIAILPTPGADVVALRQGLDRAAAARHTALTDISPSVLDPADQEELAPDLTVVLPPGATPADAEQLIHPSGPPGPTLAGVQDYLVAPVLVHDVRFTARAKDPAALAATLAREGILADALGSYSTSSARGRLEVGYTGPLLSDDLVEAVRRGIARGEGIEPSSVTVAPRSTSGQGVDLAREPAPAPASRVDVTTPAHGHGATHAAPARVADAPSGSNLWVVLAVVVALAAAVWLGVTLVRSGEEEQAPGDPVVTS